jgi:nucleotide-binding universal stress UspA family protein
MTASETLLAPARYTRIVVPLDGSEIAERALPHAITEARAVHVPIHLVRIVDILPLTQLSAVGPGIESAAYFAEFELVQAEEGAATEYLQTLQRRLKEHGLAATIEVRTDLVISGLLAVLRPEDLLVMTTHGRTGLERILMGSVAEAMVRRSPTPVFLVRATTETTRAKETTAAAGQTIRN